MLHNIATLRQVTASIATEPTHLFAPGVATRTRLGHRDPRRNPLGENPFDGAYIYYWLKETPKEHAKLEILDAQGKLIRSFTTEVKKTEDKEEFDADPEVEHIPSEVGMNRFIWDLRYQPPTKIPAAIYDNGQPTGPL